MEAVIIPEGSLKEFRVPDDILSAFNAFISLPLPIKFEADIAPVVETLDTLIAEGSLRLFKVPEDIFVAFVVSVVAD